MKRGFLILFIIIPALLSFAQKIELEGTYQGKNIYVQNPFTNKGEEFCTEKVLINGKEIYFKKASVYAILLDSLNFKIGDAIKLEIFHKPDCKPFILNDNSSPKKAFNFTSISVDSNAVLHWITSYERDSLPFIIEQFKWNKWLKIGEVQSKGGKAENEYSFQTIPHSGKNQFRIKQSNLCISKTADYKSVGPKVKFQHGHISTEVIFTEETMYEVFDQFGNPLMKGTGKTIDCRKIPKGLYYLNYDNTQGEFIKS